MLDFQENGISDDQDRVASIRIRAIKNIEEAVKSRAGTMRTLARTELKIGDPVRINDTLEETSETIQTANTSVSKFNEVEIE